MPPRVTLFNAVDIDGRAGWELDDFPSLVSSYAQLFGLRTDAVILDGERVHRMGHHEQNPEMIKTAVPPVVPGPGNALAGHPRPLLVVLDNTGCNYNWRYLQQQPWFRHILVICPTETSPAYLSYLKMRGVSYLLSGSGPMDLVKTLDTLHQGFNIQTLAAECGGPVADGLLALGKVDAMKIALAPGALASKCNIDLPGIPHNLYPFELNHCSIAGNEAMLLHYRFRVAGRTRT